MLAKASRGKPKDWLVREVDFVQQSLCRHVALSVAVERTCQPKPAKPPEPDIAAQEDYNFFDMPCLVSSHTVTKNKPGLKKHDQGSESEAVSEFSDLGAMTDLEDMFMPDTGKQLEAELKPKRKKDVDAEGPVDHHHTSGNEKDGPAAKTPSEAGSIGSRGGNVKTVATNMDLLEKALTPIGRPAGSQSIFSVPEIGWNYDGGLSQYWHLGDKGERVSI